MHHGLFSSVRCLEATISPSAIIRYHRHQHRRDRPVPSQLHWTAQNPSQCPQDALGQELVSMGHPDSTYGVD